MKRLLYSLLLLIPHILIAQSNTLPAWFIDAFKQHKLDQKYQLSSYLKPAFLEADFNGDGVDDIAVCILEKKTNCKGLLLISGRDHKCFVFGAGTSVYGGKDYKWANTWSVYKKNYAYRNTFEDDGDIKGSKKIRIMHPGISILQVDADTDGDGGIIYWNDKKWIWIHQGE